PILSGWRSWRAPSPGAAVRAERRAHRRDPAPLTRVPIAGRPRPPVVHPTDRPKRNAARIHLLLRRSSGFGSRFRTIGPGCKWFPPPFGIGRNVAYPGTLRSGGRGRLDARPAADAAGQTRDRPPTRPARPETGG